MKAPSEMSADGIDEALIPPDLLEWLRQFQRAKRRPLRVLHLGNIANNAYLNAKILRRAGIDADVASPDYYHIMGSPEWEELSKIGDYGDPFTPDWWRAGAGNFRRPEWFVQGSRDLCWRYLAARAEAKPIKTWLFGQKLIFERWRLYRRHPAATFVRWIWALRGRISAIRRSRPVRAGVALVRLLLTRKKPPAESTAATVQDYAKYGLQQEDFEQRIQFVKSDTWRTLDRYYDVVQGYALEGVYPLLSETKPYAAYEHGTIRDIPFGQDSPSRICRAAFQGAAAMFITNSDCIPAAERLGIPTSKRYPVPHGFDSRKMARFLREWRPRVLVKRDPPVFFAPARQHWKEGYATWRKGNDLIVKSAAALKQRNMKFKIVFVEWGKEVALTKDLIKELGVESHIDWIQPLQKPELWKAYLASAAVIDQFVMPAIGSVTFEAMALERPVITAIDAPALTEFFGAVPPLLNAGDQEALQDAMLLVIDDERRAEHIGVQSGEWIKRHHSSETILTRHLSAYRAILGPLEP